MNVFVSFSNTKQGRQCLSLTHKSHSLLTCSTVEISACDISAIYTSLNHRLELKKGLYPNDTQTIALLEDCHNRYIVQDAECEVI